MSAIDHFSKLSNELIVSIFSFCIDENSSETFKKITAICKKWNDLGYKSIRTFFVPEHKCKLPDYKRLNNLSYLECSGKKWSIISENKLKLLAETCNQLINITINECAIFKEKTLCKLISKNKHLKNISLVRYNSFSGGVQNEILTDQTLITMKDHCLNLTSLSLGGDDWNITKLGIESLKKCPNLKKIHFVAIKNFDASAIKLLGNQLKELYLDSTMSAKISNQNIKEIGEDCKALEVLQTARTHDESIDEGLSTAIANNPNLSFLKIDGSSIGAKTFEVFRNCRQLTCLHLFGGVNFPNEAFAALIHNAPALHEIDFDFCEKQKEELFLPEDISPSSLQKITLCSGNENITDKTLAGLITKKLQVLDITSCHISDRSVETISTADRLERLLIRLTKLSDEGMKRLEDFFEGIDLILFQR